MTDNLPTRISRQGMRFYRIPHKTRGQIYVPSVTTILGKTASEKSKRALENWAAKTLALKRKHALAVQLSTSAANAISVTSLPTAPEKYLPFWDGIERHLAKYDEVLWSERPMRPEWRPKTVAADGMPRIWSEELCYSGTPDLVGYQSGLVVLADYKTSSGKYCRNFPKDSTDREKFSGWIKFNKVAMQLCAYAIAFEETLGVHVDALQVIVSTCDDTQSFFIRGSEMEKYKNKWRERVTLFWQLMAQEDEAANRPAEMAFPKAQTPQRELVAA